MFELHSSCLKFFRMLLALLLSVSATRPAVSAARLSVSAASPAVPKAVLALRGGFNPVTALPRAYGSALASSPMATNIVTAAGLAVAADAVAQKLTGDGADWDFARTFWMVPWGALVSGLGASGALAPRLLLLPEQAWDLGELCTASRHGGTCEFSAPSCGL